MCQKKKKKKLVSLVVDEGAISFFLFAFLRKAASLKFAICVVVNLGT